MKKSVLILLFLCLAIGLSEQVRAEYMPILTVGKSWIIGQTEAYKPDAPVSYQRMTVVSQSKLQGELCVKISVQGVIRSEEGWETDPSVEAYDIWACEKEGTIYSVEIGIHSEISMDRLCSIATQPGEWVPEADLAAYPVSCELEVAGNKRTCLYFAPLVDGIPAWLVEGIGASISTIFWPYFPTGVIHKPMYTYMVECYQGDELIFTQSDFDALPTPPIAAIHTPTEASAQTVKTVTNLQGQRVGKRVKGEIYIVDGKKVIYK